MDTYRAPKRKSQCAYAEYREDVEAYNRKLDILLAKQLRLIVLQEKSAYAALRRAQNNASEKKRSSSTHRRQTPDHAASPRDDARRNKSHSADDKSHRGKTSRPDAIAHSSSGKPDGPQTSVANVRLQRSQENAALPITPRLPVNQVSNSVGLGRKPNGRKLVVTLPKACKDETFPTQVPTNTTNTSVSKTHWK